MQALSPFKNNFKIYFLNEGAITVELGHQINQVIFNKVTKLNYFINQNPFPGFKTTVPAYTTLSVFFDPATVFKSILKGINCFEKVSNYLLELNDKPFYSDHSLNQVITISVCYDKQLAPDLQEVAQWHDITTQEVIDLHSAATYKVYMIGFVPGFAYLGGMNETLATPRKATPRKIVPAGAVGIAGAQTGIYPLATPGGWQLIGQTPLKLFDANREQPSLLKAGDQVVFKPIDLHEFNRLITES